MKVINHNIVLRRQQLIYGLIIWQLALRKFFGISDFPQPKDPSAL